MPVERFGDDGVEHIARIIGEAVTGSVVDQLLAAAGIPSTGESMKWRRITGSVEAHQRRSRNGDCVIKLLAVRPQRWANRPMDYQRLPDELNGVLVDDGPQVLPDGRVQRVRAARTHDEAAALSQRLAGELHRRGGHPGVSRYCSAELVREDCFNAVFEAIKGLAERVRYMAGVDEDGHKLVAVALEGSSPCVRLNDLSTVTQRSEQTGVANLMKGVRAQRVPEPGWARAEGDLACVRDERTRPAEHPVPHPPSSGRGGRGEHPSLTTRCLLSGTSRLSAKSLSAESAQRSGTIPATFRITGVHACTQSHTTPRLRPHTESAVTRRNRHVTWGFALEKSYGGGGRESNPPDRDTRSLRF